MGRGRLSMSPGMCQRPRSMLPAFPQNLMNRLQPPASAPPDPTRVKPVRPGPGGACPEAVDFRIWPLNPGDPARPQGPAGPVPTGDGAGSTPIREARPARRRGNPDLSEEKSPKGLPTDAPAAHRS